MKSLSNRFIRNALALTTIFFWALAFIFSRIAVRYFSPLSVAALRYVTASLVLLAYVLFKRMKPPKIKDLGWFIAAGASGFGLYMIFFNLGIQTVTASVSSLLVNTSPLITSLLALLVFKEKMGIVKWAALIIAFAGVAVICLGQDGFKLETGVIWLLICGVLVSVYNIIQRILIKRYSPLEATAYSIFTGTIMLLPFLPGAIPELMSAPADEVFAIAFLGVFSTSVAYLCWTYAISRAEKMSDITNFMFLVPFLTFFMGYLGINELPPPSAYIGGALVMAGVLAANLIKAKPAKLEAKQSITENMGEAL